MLRDVASWPKSDVAVHDRDVRFRWWSGHPLRPSECLQMTQGGRSVEMLPEYKKRCKLDFPLRRYKRDEQMATHELVVARAAFAIFLPTVRSHLREMRL